MGSNHTASLGDLKVGDAINIAYSQENGSRLAHHIADGVQHNSARSTKAPGTKSQHHANTGTLSHVHGVIRSLDAQGRTITIDHKR